MSVLETRNASLTSPSSKTRNEREISKGKEGVKDKQVLGSVPKKFFRGRNYEKQDKFAIAPWGTEANDIDNSH